MTAPCDDSELAGLELPGPSATARLAGALARRLRPADVVALEGDLGSGKTTFARALINALPRPGELRAPMPPEEVPSPTFTLVQVYRRAVAEIWHFDLYRLERPDEAFELGLEEALAEGISLIEWPERLGALMPPRRLVVRLGFGAGETRRTAQILGAASWRERLAELRVDA